MPHPHDHSQSIQLLRDSEIHEATVSWWMEGTRWGVKVESPDFAPVEASADDAFEALCRVREVLEPHGWRLGVAGAQIDVWPSGMARDQGGGLRAYRMSDGGAGDLVDTFAPVDPATVVAVEEQEAEISRLWGGIPCRPRRA